jgi:membrane protease YdiL (CAAX protease family)
MSLKYTFPRNVVNSLRERDVSVPASAAVILPTIGILISEGLLYFGYTSYALWGHFLTLLGCVFAPLWFNDDAATFQVFALVPLFRLVNLGMPVFVDLTIYWFPLVYAPLLPGIYVVAQTQERARPSFNPQKAALLFPAALVLSILLAEIEYSIITPGALIPEASLAQFALISVVMFVFVGLTEELLFRGILQRVLEDRIGYWPGLMLTSLLFGMMHSAYSALTELLFAAGIGLLFGLIYDRTDSLLLITTIHASLNVFLFAVIPLSGSLFTFPMV